MALYEVVLRFPDHDEVRLADRDGYQPGTEVVIGQRTYVVVGTEPPQSRTQVSASCSSQPTTDEHADPCSRRLQAGRGWIGDGRKTDRESLVLDYLQHVGRAQECAAGASPRTTRRGRREVARAGLRGL